MSKGLYSESFRNSFVSVSKGKQNVSIKIEERDIINMLVDTNSYSMRESVVCDNLELKDIRIIDIF